MKELEDLKELYKDEIKRITKKDTLTPADDEAAKKAMEGYMKADELCRKLAGEEMGYSQRSYSHGNYSNRMPEMPYPYYEDGYSERRGRNQRNGQYMSRGASYHDETVRHTLSRLEDMRSEAYDEPTRIAIDRCINEIKGY